MVLPPSTAEELEVVLATKRRLGVSEDPQKVRKAVLELRQRRATAAWKTWYAAQQAAAQAHHALFLQWQWHMERQHAAGLAAAVMAAEQRGGSRRARRRARRARRDAEEANTAAAAARTPSSHDCATRRRPCAPSRPSRRNRRLSELRGRSFTSTRAAREERGDVRQTI